MNSIEVKPVTPSIGAEITGVDLTESLDHQQIDAIYQALVNHHVIFFRNQNISPGQRIDFARNFGELQGPHRYYPHLEGYENILILQNLPGDPPGTDVWHTDYSWSENPPFAGILWAKSVPEYGGDTLWANMCAAYQALPTELQIYCEKLRVVHDLGDFRNRVVTVDEADTNEQLTEATQNFGSVVHRLVKTHPVSNRKYLYANESFTTHIMNKSSEESNNLLRFLFNHINKPEFQVRFRWEAGSLAMWDNRCTQHYAVADYGQFERTMHRITVLNDQRCTQECH